MTCIDSNSLDSITRRKCGNEWIDYVSLLSTQSSERRPAAINKNQKNMKNINLEKCTEILGCEAGEMYTAAEVDTSARMENAKKKKKNAKERRRGPDLPPLTTIRQENRVYIIKKREKGRVVLITFKPSVFEADRSGGRFRLWMSTNVKDTLIRGAEEDLSD